jgi:hypothetical protein
MRPKQLREHSSRCRKMLQVAYKCIVNDGIHRVALTCTNAPSAPPGYNNFLVQLAMQTRCCADVNITSLLGSQGRKSGPTLNHLESTALTGGCRALHCWCLLGAFGLRVQLWSGHHIGAGGASDGVLHVGGIVSALSALQQTANNGQQTADIRQQTSDIRHQTADSREQNRRCIETDALTCVMLSL